MVVAAAAGVVAEVAAADGVAAAEVVDLEVTIHGLVIKV